MKYHTDFNEVTHVAEAEMNPAIPLTIGIHFCRIPAGSQQAQTRDETPFDMPGKAGIKSRPAPTNDFEQRTTALDELFTSLVGGIPAIQLHPRCKFLVKGLVAEPRSEQELDEWHRELRAAMPEDIFE